MPYIITKAKGRTAFLSFDSRGNHVWSMDRLDAIRYDTDIAAHECCRSYLSGGAKVVEVDRWDGHYEVHEDYEVQIYRDAQRRPAGKRWRYRIGPLTGGRAYEHSPCRSGYTTPQQALRAAQGAVDRSPRIYRTLQGQA